MTGMPQISARAHALRTRMTETCSLVKIIGDVYNETTHSIIHTEETILVWPVLD